MNSKKHLIIGAGSASLNALSKIRTIAPDDEIKLATAEDCLPYSPTALPSLLAGRITEDNLWMKDGGYFQKMKATLAYGKKVARIVPGDKTVIYEDGGYEAYDRLLIATGAMPTVSDIKGIKLGFGGFHTLKDCRRLLRALRKPGKKVVTIYGGGLVAMEIAEALIERGCAVNIIVRSRILRSYFEPHVGTMIHNIFSAAGAHIFTGNKVKELESDNGRITVNLTDGSHFNTDIFLTALGVSPRIDLVHGTEIKVNRGIIVDRRMRTSVDDIYAAGDVAEAWDFFTRKPSLNAILPAAARQGEVAGANMAGGDLEYEGNIPMNTLNFLGNRAFSIGLTAGEGSITVLEEEDKAQCRLKRMVFEGDCLVGTAMLNMDVDPGIMLYLIKNRLELGTYKDALFEKPVETSRFLMLRNERA